MRSNIFNDIPTGRYRTRTVDCFRQFHRRGRLTDFYRSIAFVNAPHHKNATQRPAACSLSPFPACPAGCSHGPGCIVDAPSHPMERFMHPSGMWLAMTKERGPGRILFPALLSACHRSSPTVSRSMRGAFACGGVSCPVEGSWTKTFHRERALDDV